MRVLTVHSKMADQVVKFVSATELNARKQEKRKAREQILNKAKADYEREERRRTKRKETGEDTWMLDSVNDRIGDQHKKKKKKKEKKDRDKKSKKHKKRLKKEKEDSSDKWVVKGADNMEDDNMNDANKKEEMATQRESWMLFPCFSGSTTAKQLKKEEDEAMKTEEEKKLSPLDMPGQHPKELNPYWKDGGLGLPSAYKSESDEIPSDVSPAYDVMWLKKSLQRSTEQAEEEGRSLEAVVADRWGSLERLKEMIAEAEQRSSEEQDRSKRKRDRDQRGDKERTWRRDDRHHNRNSDYRKDLEKRTNQDGRTERNISKSREREILNYANQRDRDSRKSSSEGRYNYYSRPSRTETSTYRWPDTASVSSLSSLKFMKPSEQPSSASTSSSMSERGSKCGPSSGSWRKKNSTDEMTTKTNRIEQALKNRKEKTEKNNRRNSSSESSESEVDETISESDTGLENQFTQQDEAGTVDRDSSSAEPTVPFKRITEADLNSMGAKILRAALMGNEELASELKANLEQMRREKEAQESSASCGKETKEVEIVILTRTDKYGNTRPVNISETQESKGGRRKKEKFATHDQSGQRERYFADDDQYDLKEVVRREKMNTAEDYNSMFSRLASKGATKTDFSDFTLDDYFVTGAANKLSKAKEEEKERMRAIREYQRLSDQPSRCQFCFENPDLAKHLIIAIGIQVYLALPMHTSLTEGHCLIIPMQHQVASTCLDENVVDEINVFKKGLTRLFLDMDKDVVFLETCRNLTRQNHMIIECIPLPKEEGELAPMYFKKAILESESEWTQNKKLVDTKQKGLRGSIPKGLPYFSVEFGLDGGYAHVIEDEHAFPHYFGKEIIGGMLDLEPKAWHKPHKENFEQHKKKVLQFADWWKPYDWTKRLKNK